MGGKKCVLGMVVLALFLSGSAVLADENWTTYNKANTSDLIAHNSIRAVELDGGITWVGTSGGGMSKYDGTNWTLYQTGDGLVNNYVWDFAIDGSGDLWIATNGGVSKYDGTNFTNYTTSNSDLNDNNCREVAIESDGTTIWISTLGGGVNKFDGTNWSYYKTTNSDLPNNNAWGIAIDSDDNKWFTTMAGVAKFDGTDWDVYGNEVLPHDDVYDVVVDSDDNPWFGTIRGVSMLDGTTWTTYEEENGMPKENTRSLDIDSSGTLWVGSYNGGALKYDGNWTQWNTGNSDIANNYVWAVDANSPTELWFATNLGVSVLEITGAVDANFSASPTSGDYPLTVDFNDASTGGITSWSWTFGDGGTSNLASPSHTYNSDGVYTVSLTVSGSGSSDTMTKEDYISVSTPLQPVAAFSASPLTGDYPLVVDFNDQSGGVVTGWSWSFGDGGTSTAQNPSHTYSTDGDFTVSLTATGPSGTDNETKTDYITVTIPPPYVDFDASPTTGNYPLAVEFTDTSTGSPATSWSWTFGDGSTSTEQDPNHTYSSPGVYSVGLSVSNAYGSDSVTRTDHIAAFTGGDDIWNSYKVADSNLSDNNVRAVLVDGNSVWVGSLGGGIDLIEGDTWTNYKTTEGLVNNSVYDFVKDAGGNLWIATNGGMSRYDGTNFTNYTTSNSDLNDNNCRAVAVDTDGSTIWIATNGGGINKFDGTNWTGYKTANSSLPHNTAWGVAVDSDGIKWFATLAGGARFDGTNWEVYGAEVLPHDDVYDVELALDGSILFGTTRGIGRYDGTNWTTYEEENGMPEESVRAVATDSAGVLWAATVNTGGLNRYNGANWTQYKTATCGIAGNNVWDVDFVSPADIWVATDTGLSHLQIGGTGVPDAPDANFSASPTSGDYPLVVSFTDLSTGEIDSWSWSFGDGGTSTQQSPGHIYDTNGTYTVSLTVQGPIESDNMTKTDYINVSMPITDANFYGSPTSGDYPLLVSFTDTSTGDNSSWSWDFGDGGTSTLHNPSHTYNAAGDYTVSLTVTGASGTDDKTRTDYISVTTPPVPDANFTGTPTSGDYPLQVGFTDTSTGTVTSWSWTFGDGGTSIAQNPNHTYDSNGTYTVSLTATGPSGSDIKTGTDYITVSTPVTDANFTASPTSGYAPLVVTFADLSYGDNSSWSWNFGDGNEGPLQSPVHTYDSCGVYTVSLTVTGATGSDIMTKTDYITVTDVVPPTAAFTASPTSGNAPLNVSFTDTSTGNVTSWEWDFGDEVSTSTAQNPSHTYEQSGDYTVKLTVTGPAGSDSETKTDYISVSALAPVANFTAVPTTGSLPLIVTFDNTSTGEMTSWSWTFGDGDTSTERDPTHIYDTEDTYTVSLTSTGPGGSDNETKTDFIDVLPPPPVADFSASPEFGYFDLAVDFNDASTGDYDSWSWNFGDGSTSTIQNPSHTYDTNGTYTVSLTVTGDGGSNTETRNGYIRVFWPGGYQWFNYLDSKRIRCVEVESDGTRWIGTYSDGAYKYDGTNWTQYKTELIHERVHSIAFDSSDNIWFATLEGVSKYDGTNWTEYDTSNSDLPNNDCRAIAADSSGNIWVGTDGSGVAKFDGTDWTTYDKSNSGILDNIIYDIEIDSGGDLWFAVWNDGVSKFDGTNWTNYTTTDGLINARVWAVSFEGDGTKWFATEDGVSEFDGTNWTDWDTADGMNNDKSFDISVCPDNIVYVSTYDGVCKIDPNTSTLTNYNTTDGLAHQSSYAVMAEDELNIWFGTEDGLSLYHFVPEPPIAEFTASPRAGADAPHDVNFTDQSISPAGAITDWSWNFGDGSTSTQQNPSHTYTDEGIYSVTLQVESIAGTDSLTKTDYIAVGGPMASVSPESLVFNMAAGTSANQDLTLSNEGGEDLSYTAEPNVYGESEGGAGGPGAEGLEMDEDKMFGFEHAPGILLVGFKPDVDVSELAAKGVAASQVHKLGAQMKVKKLLNKAKAKGKRGRLIQRIRRRKWAAMEFNGNVNLKALRKALLKDPHISAVEPDYIIRIDKTPNDPKFGQQYALLNIGQPITVPGNLYPGGTPDADIDATDAWDVYTGSDDVVVGIIDTGIDYTHEDLDGKIWTNPGETPGNNTDDDDNGYKDDIHGWDFSNNDSNPMDDHGHGTHCAGVIAAETDNSVGIAGVSWHAKVAGLKFLDSDGYGWTSDAVSAVDYANAMGFQITSNSWGGGGYSQALKDAIDEAGAADYLFIAAAGNLGRDTDATPYYPQSYTSENLISVAATGRYDDLRPWSNYGQYSVDLAAPGSLILSCLLNDTYDYWSGTSMAAPHVSGVAALLMAYNPALSALDVKDVILDNTDALSELNGKCISGGRLNALKALTGGVMNPTVSVSPESGIVPPDDSNDITVTVDAVKAAAGTYNDQIIFDTNDPLNPTLEIPVTMNITGVKKLSVSPTSYDLGWVPADQQRQQLIKLKNEGSAATSVSSISINDNHFTHDANTPVTVPAYSSVTVTVTFDPTSIDKETATMTITSDASDNPTIYVSLSAVGVAMTNYSREDIATNGNDPAEKVDIIRDIIEDSSGNIWTANTSYGADPDFGGVSKFNGSTWTNYRSELASNITHCLDEDSYGNIWIGAGGYMTKYTGSSWTNYYVGYSGYSVVVDSDGTTVWCADDEYWKYSAGSFSEIGDVPGDRDITDMAVDDNNDIWCASKPRSSSYTDGGVLKFDGTNWTVYDNATISGSVHAVAVSPVDDSKWFLVQEKGVAKFDGSTWTIYDEQNGFPWNGEIYDGDISVDSNGVVWVALYEGWSGGFLRFDGSTWQRFDSNNASLPAYYNCVFSIFAESPTKIWVAGLREGVTVYTIPSGL